MFVSYINNNSESKKLYAGVPQGSVLGPILFNIFINDAPKTKNVDESLFADDKAYFTSSCRVSAITRRLQEASVKISKYYDKWKIKLNTSKTEAIIFTKRRPCITNKLLINGTHINWSDNVKYLGLHLDKKLTFTKHVNHVIQKSIGSLIKFYPILNRKSKLSSSNKLNIYKVFIRPALLYACPAWNFICNSNYNKLQVAQNRFLRLAGNYPRYTYVHDIHVSLNIETIREFVNRITLKYFRKAASHQNELLRNVIYEKANYKHKRVMHSIYNV